MRILLRNVSKGIPTGIPYNPPLQTPRPPSFKNAGTKGISEGSDTTYAHIASLKTAEAQLIDARKISSEVMYFSTGIGGGNQEDVMFSDKPIVSIDNHQIDGLAGTVFVGAKESLNGKSVGTISERIAQKYVTAAKKMLDLLEGSEKIHIKGVLFDRQDLGNPARIKLLATEVLDEHLATMNEEDKRVDDHLMRTKFVKDGDTWLIEEQSEDIDPDSLKTGGFSNPAQTPGVSDVLGNNSYCYKQSGNNFINEDKSRPLDKKVAPSFANPLNFRHIEKGAGTSISFGLLKEGGSSPWAQVTFECNQSGSNLKASISVNGNVYPYDKPEDILEIMTHFYRDGNPSNITWLKSSIENYLPAKTTEGKPGKDRLGLKDVSDDSFVSKTGLLWENNEEIPIITALLDFMNKNDYHGQMAF